jgi:hypothetical protein
MTMAKIKSLNDIPAIRAYLMRVGAEPRSLKTAVIRETHGHYWKDLAVIRFKKEGDGCEVIVSAHEYNPTDLELKEIQADVRGAEWPTTVPVERISKPPQMIADADRDDVYQFRNAEGRIVMVQVRIERDGEKNYVPWTYWDDGEWRMCEPDGPLPLYNADRLADAFVVFVHEGAKAARRMQEMVDRKDRKTKEQFRDHPWAMELENAVHVGWIGGAMSPYRTDWSQITRAGVKRAYIVADNDKPGREAVPPISQQLRIPTFAVQFTDEWPGSFDLADEFPEAMFGSASEGRHYIGPSFRDCLHPATWATDLVPNPKGKATPTLRDSFRAMWAYVEEADVYVCTEMPEIIRTEAILNRMLAPFSHVAETARLIVKSYRGRSARICYRPDQEGLNVTFRGSSAINLHVPPTIKPEAGDPGPWLEFLDYMFIHEAEREEVRRWCATLIARPDIRMGYALLLISERQGIGKTTLGANVLAPLVGYHNVGHPGEADILSAFNDWMSNKRLVVVNEVYFGSSWKAYHSLKSVITDRDVTVNQKYQRPYTIENWCHIFACSNSMRALKMENDDRRWFYPEVTEVSWPKGKFVAFRKWLDGGGLNIIADWARNFGSYIEPSDRAPMTERKREMIEGSRSEAQSEAAALAEMLKDRSEPTAMFIKDVAGWARATVQGRVFDSDYELRRTMIECGVICWSQRFKVYGRMQYAMMNDALARKIEPMADAEAREAIRAAAIKPAELMEGEM